MKILVVQLMRLGDILMSSAINQGLQNKYPEAEISFLINEDFSQAKFLIDISGSWMLFPRKALQKSMGDSQRPLFSSYDSLKSWIEDLNSKNFDWVINLTHNRQSAHLMSLINVTKKTGAVYDFQKGATFGSPWFAALDRSAGLLTTTRHIIDIWSQGVGLSTAPQRLPLNRSHVHQKQPLILLQPLTNDKKKNWSLHNWKNLAEILQTLQPTMDVRVLAAPTEKDLLTELNIPIEACDLSSALSLIDQAQLFITADTSIKHLAAATETPILEIALGSSNPFFTGAWTNNSVIVYSHTHCSPCPHSRPCSRESHKCAEQLKVNDVAQLAHLRLQDNWQGIQDLLRNEKNLRVLRVSRNSQGFWESQDLGENCGIERDCFAHASA